MRQEGFRAHEKTSADGNPGFTQYRRIVPGDSHDNERDTKENLSESNKLWWLFQGKGFSKLFHAEANSPNTELGTRK